MRREDCQPDRRRSQKVEQFFHIENLADPENLEIS